ncbi:sensor histidine kinase [Bradyrhizobium elkanii]|uniref:Blue-light-activated histidine kinase n=1 Tax=Bradyrhizobium elkanii TaxID=29448 RepID=A0A8I1Y6M5_BRAEL|nr:sensor histidine kinase [Bradyrhizobium elkanii]MBP1294212.1 PAS domain S-box-containing protein [Bradyrhizobium elkanii]
MSDLDPEITQILSGSGYSPTSSVPSDAPRSFRRKPVSTSIKVVANAARAALGLRDEEQAFALPVRLFEQLPFAVYVCDRNGLVLRYNRRAAELWGRSPKPGDPNERFCGSYRMFRPDGSLLPHHQCPMADVLRSGISVREQEVHIERPDGLRGIALVDIEAIKDIDGNIVGAVNCFQDITERKRNEAQIVNLAREAEHRTKNILSTVLATVRLSRADTSDDLKQLIEGRIAALAKVHGLFVQSRWAGAELHSLATQELSPYGGGTEGRVRIDGPAVMLEPNTAQTVAISLHELATNAAKYGSLSAAGGHVEITWSRTTDGRLILRWIESGGPPVAPPTHRGFGRSIMENIIAGQLRGEVRFDWDHQGLTCEIVLPLAEVVPPLA